MKEDPAEWLRRSPLSLSTRAMNVLAAATRRTRYGNREETPFPGKDESLFWLFDHDAYRRLKTTLLCGRITLEEISGWLRGHDVVLGGCGGEATQRSPRCGACGKPCLECSSRNFETAKVLFHQKYLAVFKALAKLLGLPKGSYDLTSNKGGHAVMGEVWFHTGYAFAQVSPVVGFEEFFVREARGRKDFDGHENKWYPLSHLEGDMRGALTVFRDLKKRKEVLDVMQGANPEATYVHLCPKKS